MRAAESAAAQLSTTYHTPSMQFSHSPRCMTHRQNGSRVQLNIERGICAQNTLVAKDSSTMTSNCPLTIEIALDPIRARRKIP
jgi:hypothetical protein